MVARLSDRVLHDDRMLRYPLLIVGADACLLSALLWWLGLNSYRSTLAQAESLRPAS